jgi:hypothetical protein
MHRLSRTYPIGECFAALFSRGIHRAQRMRGSSISIGQKGQKKEVACSNVGDVRCWAVAATAA